MARWPGALKADFAVLITKRLETVSSRLEWKGYCKSVRPHAQVPCVRPPIWSWVAIWAAV
jgi:hypothetical protein